MTRCPICGKPAQKENPDFPFCSERCRTIDLGNWASEKYVIPGEEKSQDEAEDGE